MAAIQQELNRKAYWIILYFRPFISTSDRRLLNFVRSPLEFGASWNMHAWKVRGH